MTMMAIDSECTIGQIINNNMLTLDAKTFKSIET